MKNVPYVKQYAQDGTLVNPIDGAYLNKFPNRKTRRPKRFRFKPGIVVVGINKFRKYLQTVNMPDGTVKRIEHYVPA